MKKEHPKDGSFVVLFSGSFDKWKNINIFLGKRSDDGLWELLGGGFDVLDITPPFAACREVEEETSRGIKLKPDNIEYFSHMVQKIPNLKNEKGHAFYFLQPICIGINTDLCIPSFEHSDLAWHDLESVFTLGEAKYKTATLRVLLIFLRYLNEKKFHFGILGEKINFLGYIF